MSMNQRCTCLKREDAFPRHLPRVCELHVEADTTLTAIPAETELTNTLRPRTSRRLWRNARRKELWVKSHILYLPRLLEAMTGIVRKFDLTSIRSTHVADHVQ